MLAMFESATELKKAITSVYKDYDNLIPIKTKGNKLAIGQVETIPDCIEGDFEGAVDKQAIRDIINYCNSEKEDITLTAEFKPETKFVVTDTGERSQHDITGRTIQKLETIPGDNRHVLNINQTWDLLRFRWDFVPDPVIGNIIGIIDGVKFSKLASALLNTTAKNEPRKSLETVNITRDNLLSCDGHRATFVKNDCIEFIYQDDDINICIDKDSVKRISGHKTKDLEIEIYDRILREDEKLDGKTKGYWFQIENIGFEGFEYGLYPNLDVIYREFDRSNKDIEIDKKDLVRLTKQAKKLAENKVQCSKLQIEDNTLSFMSNNPNEGESTVKMEIESNGNELYFGINLGYLLQVLQKCKDKTILLNGIDHESMLTIKDEKSGLNFGIMPMRLQ